MSKPENINRSEKDVQTTNRTATKQKKGKMAGVFLDQQKPLKTFISRFIRRPQDIDDIAQETFVRAFVAEQKSDISHPKAYLYRIARNLSLEALSKKSARMTSFIEDSCDESMLKTLQEVKALKGVETRVDQLQKLEQLKLIVADLPPKCQRVFIMHKVYGFKYREIAKQLGISVSTVEKHIITGLKRCRDAIRKKDNQQNVSQLYADNVGVEK